jgi:N-acetyl sugar amidotransferase|tara:strand:+ start:693 stop:1895 length:1203 start_codon:yes stop_codon:yes gene_type:complete
MEKISNSKIIFCKKCVESNQRYIGSIPFADTKTSIKQRTSFEDEICGACKYFEQKKTINWKSRENELIKILDKHRKSNGDYDVLIPGSGGKDSIFLSHVLKYKYKMNPLTVTWSPHIYTDIGLHNLRAWQEMGFDNELHTPNPKVHKKLTQLAFKNLLHPFQPFVIGQHNLAPKLAIEKKIKLIVYGDASFERGVGGNVYSISGIKNNALFTADISDLYFGGVHISELKKFGISAHDIKPYLPLNKDEIEIKDLTVLNLPYYNNYNPQDNFYFASENSDFKVNPYRSEGTYTKYSSLDDKLDNLHYYTWFIKTGRGRATEDAALEVRNNIITREEAVALVKKYDGEFPIKYFKDILNYLEIDEKEFNQITDRFRPEHIWKKEKDKWILRSAVWMKESEKK